MKKLAIVGASAALAAMPVVGVFAATQTSVVDTVQLTVTKTCAMDAAEAAKTVNLGSAIAGSEYAEKAGSVLTVTCNGTAGWEITATATSLIGGADTTAIPFGAYPTTAESKWSAKLTASGGTVATGWDNYAGTQASNTVVLSGNQVNAITVTPAYKARTSATQANGSYEGTITYTFTDKTGN